MVQITFEGKEETRQNLLSKGTRQVLVQEQELARAVKQQEADYEQIRIRHNLEKYGKIEITYDEIKLRDRMALCGKIAKKNFYCRECEKLGKPCNQCIVKTIRTKFFCGIRYCKDPDCKCHLFSNCMDRLREIKDFKGLKTLWHWAIGFPPIPLEEFKNNYAVYKKEHERILNTFFKKLRKLGIEIRGVRTPDFSFVKEGSVYPHYHLGIKPISSSIRRKVMITVQAVRASMIKNSRKGITFHVQMFKHAQIDAVLAYMSIRAIGLYKYDETIDPNYKIPQKGNLKKSILEGKYQFLSDVMNEEQFLKNVHRKKFFVGFGGITAPSHGSITTDTMTLECKEHGEISGYDQVRLEVIFDLDPGPPDLEQKEAPITVEVVKIDSGN